MRKEGKMNMERMNQILLMDSVFPISMLPAVNNIKYIITTKWSKYRPLITPYMNCLHRINPNTINDKFSVLFL